MTMNITTACAVETLDDLIDALVALREVGVDSLTLNGTIDFVALGTEPVLEPIYGPAEDEPRTYEVEADEARHGWDFRSQCVQMLRRSYACEPGSIFCEVGGHSLPGIALAPYVERVAMAPTFKMTPTSFPTGRGAAAEREAVEMKRRWPDLDLNTTIGWLLDAGCQLAAESSDESDAS